MLIKDVIYRFVTVPSLCRAFMDTAEFNRLRNIKQLGLAHLVYPSATHSRFEHSIGVMHLAGKVADVLNISGREKDLLQLAAMFHDVGHVALSHLFDYILIEKKVAPNLSHHEHRSIFILGQINQRLKLLTAEEETIIAKMILGDNTNTDKPYLFEIVSNKVFGLDVDRLDYLQRDMYHVSMPCFQADYIIENLRIRNGHLSILSKALPEIEMMYEARRRLLLLVCRHKAVCKAEKLMRQAIDRLNITGEWFEKNWLILHDARLQVMLEEGAGDILERIHQRDWDHIEPASRYDHISYINRDDIDQQLRQVNLADES